MPFDDLMGEDASRNWDHDRRQAELEADGIVAEVVFPNTIPPFYPEPSLKVQVPGATEAISSSDGPGCGPTTGGWPTSAPPHPGDGSESSRSCCTTSPPPCRESNGRPRPA